VSANASTSTGSSSGFLGFFRINFALVNPTRMSPFQGIFGTATSLV
jgi:hypothetical protein